MNLSAKVLGILISLGTLALGCSVQTKAETALTNIAAVTSDADGLVLKLQDTVAQVSSRIAVSEQSAQNSRWTIVAIVIVLLILHNVHLHFKHWKIDSVEV